MFAGRTQHSEVHQRVRFNRSAWIWRGPRASNPNQPGVLTCEVGFPACFRGLNKGPFRRLGREPWPCRSCAHCNLRKQKPGCPIWSGRWRNGMTCSMQNNSPKTRHVRQLHRCPARSATACAAALSRAQTYSGVLSPSDLINVQWHLAEGSRSASPPSASRHIVPSCPPASSCLSSW